MAKDKNISPLILIFSPREKIRNILSAGFIQCNFQVMEATTSYIAGVKANQYLPDVILADITRDNIKDFLFLTRLERSVRTKEIAVVISVTADVKKALDKIKEEVGQVENSEEKKRVLIIEYPFSFNDLLKKINTLFAGKPLYVPANTPGESAESNNKGGGQLFDFQVTVQKKLRLIESSVDKQWAFPFTIIRSLEILGSEKSCCNELAKCIEADLAATSAILTIANKVHYASRYGRISSVLDAIVRIGFDDTRNLLASLSLINISSDVHLKYGFKRAEFWMHSLATAIIAEKLCRNVKIERPELAFVAGLIHDIGKIPLDNNFTDIFLKLLEETTSKIASFYAVEQRMMGFSHAETGHFFTTNWNFPTYITLAILNHHNPDKILNTKIQLDRLLQESVFVGNLLAKALYLGHSCDEVLCAIPAKMLKDLEIPEGPKELFLNKTFDTIKLYYEYLKITADQVTLYEPPANTKDIEIYIVSGKNANYHPVISGLKCSGLQVKIVESLPEKIESKGAVAIFIPDKEAPLDITLTADEEENKNTPSILKIYVLEDVEIEEPKKDVSHNSIVFLNSNRVDLRLLIQVIEDFYYATTM